MTSRPALATGAWASDDRKFPTITDGRSPLAGVVATLGLGSLAVAGTDPNADAELLRLEGEVNAARERWREMMSRIYNDLEEKVIALLPPRPDPYERVGMPPEIMDAFGKITVSEISTIKNVAPDHPYAVWSRKVDADEEARIGERDAYGAECDRLYAEHGVTAADKAQEAQFDRAEEICAELLDTRAVSLTGVMVKLRLREWMDYHEGEERILASVAADLERWEQALRDVAQAEAA